MSGARRLAVSVVVLAAVAWGLLATSQAPPVPETFAGRIAALSEPGGYFDTDNLISNERSYLHVVPALGADGVRGGVYLGVGPDQNFSYIAHVRPSLALVVDIRRDNMLLHLLFKALFELAPTRVEYLAALTGRAPPGEVERDPSVWASRSIDELVAHVDTQAPAGDPERAALAARVRQTIDTFGMPLSDRDHATIARFHRRFIDAGLSLRFNSTGRPPQWNYPTYRDLLLETDRDGIRRSFLARESDYGFVRSLQARGLVLPVVGDLGGDTALRAITRFLDEQDLAVSAFYTSNVEFYLFRQGGFGSFVENLARLPRTDAGLIVRSAFTGVRPAPGYNSVSMTQPIRALVEGHAAGRFRRYQDLLSASR
jgi:hypothetical protein